ncbi:unnamed protein product [Microthlaspi erraticum]|uniref:F-box domain-containing protein n=1 Tax=Microthlaspi erraticum TaxID=1685480 RepID=A0A6D2IWH2_9BRAS|nr:unnamed protein product [Microthlaspi erraticum]
MTMMSNLPRDLVEEILSRLPLKSTRAMRLTCKNWNALSKSQSFTKIHIDKVAVTREEESQMIVMMDNTVYLKSAVVNGIHVDLSKEPKGKLTCLDEQVKISYFLHCEGLLLYVLGDDDSRLVVWNPYLGQTRSITPRSYYHNREMYNAANHFAWYEIYDFDSDSWTTLDVTPKWRISSCNRGVSLKGNTYWCARRHHSHYLICFDFTCERFGSLLHLPQTNCIGDSVNLSCVGEEKLAALVQFTDSNKTEIWITTKIEAEEVSWSKFLTLDQGPVVYNPDLFINGSFLINKEKKVTLVFDTNGFNRYTVFIVGETGYIREVDFGEPEYRYYYSRHVSSYVPSLVQIKQPQGGKRKRQSDLEMLRYDEKRLKLVALEKKTKKPFRGFRQKRRQIACMGSRRWR